MLFKITGNFKVESRRRYRYLFATGTIGMFLGLLVIDPGLVGLLAGFAAYLLFLLWYAVGIVNCCRGKQIRLVRVFIGGMWGVLAGMIPMMFVLTWHMDSLFWDSWEMQLFWAYLRLLVCTIWGLLGFGLILACIGWYGLMRSRFHGIGE